MGRITWEGALAIVILFIIGAVFLASKITVAGAEVTIPGYPADPTALSLLDVIWESLPEWLRTLF